MDASRHTADLNLVIKIRQVYVHLDTLADIRIFAFTIQNYKIYQS